MNSDEREDLLDMLSDMSKDVNGFRNRSLHLLTDAQLEELAQSYQASIDYFILTEKTEEEKMLDLLKGSNVDLETLRRWIKEAEDAQ